MAATAATAVDSSFSSLHCIRSKLNRPNCDHLLKISSTRTPNLTLSSSLDSSFGSEGTSIYNKWRTVPRLAEVPAAVEEEVVVEENGGEGSHESSSEGVNTKLYFGNLPHLCTVHKLLGLFKTMLVLSLLRETGKSRGFAFVTMSSLEDCETVIKNLDGREYGGRTISQTSLNQRNPFTQKLNTSSLLVIWPAQSHLKVCHKKLVGVRVLTI